MSFSKAKLKRFNDVDIVGCNSSPAASKALNSAVDATTSAGATGSNGSTAFATVTSSSSSSAHSERKEQIEKFFKDAVRFTSSSKEAKEFAIAKDGTQKEDKKSKGLRLFRTPSLPQRLRFRHNSDATTANTNNNGCSGTTSSTPLHSATTTPVKELLKPGSRLKGKEALQHDIRKKNELIENYMSQIDVLKRHVEQLKQTEQKLREEHANFVLKTETLIQALQAENAAHKELNDRLSAENAKLGEECAQLKLELQANKDLHAAETESLNGKCTALELKHVQLDCELQHQSEEQAKLSALVVELKDELRVAHEKLLAAESETEKKCELIENFQHTNSALIEDAKELKAKMEKSAHAHAQEIKTIHNEIECLKNERNTLKSDLASKCELIRSLQDELLDKNCEIDAHCDTIRQLCREKASYAEKERLMEMAEEKVRAAELQAEQTAQKLESDLENAIEREKAYWRSELEKRQKLAENEIIKVELEKQDVMVLLENTNDMLRDRDEKIQKYEEQLRNGVDYYIQLTDNLQKQLVDLKQDVAKTITEKYNYQLTLSNTRSTVNILMERLKKSDADVEQFKAELESVQLAKGALEQSYLALQAELETLRAQNSEAEAALKALHESSQSLQLEVSIKENMFNEILTSEDETLAKFNKIASSFQERIETANVAHCLELKRKDEAREVYMQDLRKALDEFATVLQFAQIELDSKEKLLHKVRDECEQLKLENISLKSKLDETGTKKENSTDLEKIEDLLIDSELRAECDKITSWLLSSSSSDKCVRAESSNEMTDLLKPTTPSDNNKSRNVITPVRTSSSGRKASTANVTGTTVTTPRTPCTPKAAHTPRSTPRKKVLFAGKENVCSPQKPILKARNV